MVGGDVSLVFLFLERLSVEIGRGRFHLDSGLIEGIAAFRVRGAREDLEGGDGEGTDEEGEEDEEVEEEEDENCRVSEEGEVLGFEAAVVGLISCCCLAEMEFTL